MKKLKFKTPNEKTKKNKRGIRNIILSIILMFGIAGVTLLLGFALYIIISSPDFETDKLYSKEATVLYYSDGSELTRFGSQNRVLVSYDELPQVLVDAIIATEDSRFFQHTGLDIARFAKATAGQLMGNSKAGGASTLTMQVIKKAYTSGIDTGIKGIIRKFTDIYMAIFKLESNYTKEEIIEFYVNSMWLGYDGNLNYTGIAGVEQASNYYFGKSVSDLTLAEASILAGMFQNPTTYNPYKNPKGVTNRQNTVLKLMVQHGYITEEEKEAVQRIPVSSLLVDRKQTNNKMSQAAIDYVLEEVEKDTGIDPYTVPMKIYTTIDRDVQDVLIKLENGEIYEFPNEYIQEGIAITSVENGSVVALSGGRNYQAKGTNRAIEIKRQPGSTAKILFDYGPYIEYLNGSTYSPFLDEKTTYSNGTSIKNSNNQYNGLMTMRSALIGSRNIPALLAFQAVADKDINLISNFVHSLGINYGKELYESASIGGFDGVSPLQMSAAYAAFARGGYYIEPYVYTKVVTAEGVVIKEHKYKKEEVMSKETAYMITDMLISATEAGVGGVKVSGTDIASKGGTTTIDKKIREDKGLPNTATMDAWNITYNPEYSIALWAGYDKLSSEYYLNSTIGGRVRNGIMKAVGSRVYSKNKTFDELSSVIEVPIEKETFPPQRASEYTPSDLITYELFREGTEPSETEISTRFSKLEAPTNGNYTFDGTTLKLTWDAIKIPDAISTNYLQEHFNTYYGSYASQYYQKRLDYNNSYIGTLGYQIYRKDASGTLSYIGRTEDTNYIVSNPLTGNITYIIKSAYSIFTANMSDGLTITVNSSIDSNVDNMVDNSTTNSDISGTIDSNNSNELE